MRNSKPFNLGETKAFEFFLFTKAMYHGVMAAL